MSGFTTTDNINAARKAHKCDWCGETIEVGQPYSRWRSFENDYPMTIRVHPECLVAINEAGDELDEGWTIGDNPRGCNCGFHKGCPRCAEREADAMLAAKAKVADEEIEAIAACLEDDAAIVREVDGYEEVPDNMEKAAALIRRLAAKAPAEAKVSDDVLGDAIYHIAALAHLGGLKDEPADLLCAIRKLSLPWFDGSGTARDLERRVTRAMIAAKAKEGAK